MCEAIKQVFVGEILTTCCHSSLTTRQATSSIYHFGRVCMSVCLYVCLSVPVCMHVRR